MSIPLSPQRAKLALNALERRIDDGSTTRTRSVNLNRTRLRRVANELEAVLAAAELAAEVDPLITFTAPRRDSIQENSLIHLREFIGRLEVRIAALEAATA